MSDDLLHAEEAKLLLTKIVSAETFHLVFIVSNPYESCPKIAAHLEAEFSSRSGYYINETNFSIDSFLALIESGNVQFIFFADFISFLSNPEHAAALNQSRDRIASYPIHILCFIPVSANLQEQVARVVPDFWSIRSAVISYIEPIAPVINTSIQEEVVKTAEIRKAYQDTYNRLKPELDNNDLASTSNIPLLLSQFKQFLEVCLLLGKSQEGIQYAQNIVNQIVATDLLTMHPETFVETKFILSLFFHQLNKTQEALLILQEVVHFLKRNENLPESLIINISSWQMLMLQSLHRDDDALDALFQIPITMLVPNFSLFSIQVLTSLIAKKETVPEIAPLIGTFSYNRVTGIVTSKIDLADNYTVLGLAYYVRNRKAEAFEYLSNALAVGKETLGAQYHDVQVIEDFIAHHLSDL